MSFALADVASQSGRRRTRRATDVISRLLAGTVLGVAGLALPAVAAGQQSAAVDVRIVVAPVDRLGFDEAPSVQEPSSGVEVTSVEARGSGPALSEDRGVQVPAARNRAGLQQSGEERVAPCARPVERRSASAPEVSVTYGVWQ